MTDRHGLPAACREFVPLLAVSTVDLNPADSLRLAAHLDSCTACRSWQQALKEIGSVPQDLPILPAPGLQKVAPMPGLLRFVIQTGLLLMGLAGLLLTVLGNRGWQRLSASQAETFAFIALAASLLALYLTCQAWKPGSRAYLTVGRFTATGLLAAALFFFFAFSWHPDWPHFLTSAAVCIGIGTATSALTAVAIWYASRRGYATDPDQAAWAGGVLAALTAWCVLQIYCPKQEQSHLLFSHLAALVSGGLAGVAILRRFLAQR
jgi:xanthine/uracil permease